MDKREVLKRIFGQDGAELIAAMSLDPLYDPKKILFVANKIAEAVQSDSVPNQVVAVAVLWKSFVEKYIAAKEGNNRERPN